VKTVSKILVACAAAILWAGHPGDAQGQAYDGCFVNGQQVADSMCQGGGGGGAPSIMANPMFGNLMSMSNMLGGAIVKYLLAPPPQGNAAPAYDSAAAEQARLQQLKAQQDQRLATERANVDAAALQDQRQFEADRNSLLGEVHQLGGGASAGNLSVVGTKGAFGSAELKPHSLVDAYNAPVDKDLVPHPIYRDATDARDYPALPSFTKEERDAHDYNAAGVRAAEIDHDWVGAWGTFAYAYDLDPFGPFSYVIRDNMELAARKIDQERAKKSVAPKLASLADDASPSARGAGMPTPASASPVPMAPGSSTSGAPSGPSAPSAPPGASTPASPTAVKAVLPKTFAECNAEFQAQTVACQRADGSWDKEGCFNPAWKRLSVCVNGLTEASVR